MVALIVSAAPAPNTAAINFTFNFDFVSNPDLQNFWLYTGPSSSNYTSKISMGTSTNYILGNLPRNTLYFCNVTAFSTNGVEGDFTTEISIKTFNKPKVVTSLNATQKL